MIAINPSSWLRRKVEAWLVDHMVNYGPCMYRVRNEWRYVDYYGSLWRLIPTNDPSSSPFVIMCQERG